MPRSNATTVSKYLSELEKPRRDVVAAVRAMVLAHLPAGYQERMNWGMISYEVPLARHGGTYNGQPLLYASLAAQKNYYALYLMSACNPKHAQRLQQGFKAAGKKLDMGKSCLRFKTLEDLPLDVVAEVVASTPPEVLIEQYESSRRPQRRRA
jgi:hypothetical protein